MGLPDLSPRSVTVRHRITPRPTRCFRSPFLWASTTTSEHCCAVRRLVRTWTPWPLPRDQFPRPEMQPKLLPFEPAPQVVSYSL